LDPELPFVKEEVSGEAIQRKPKTEIRKPRKSKKVEEVDPIVLRKRMRQLYKAVVNYQVTVAVLLCLVYSFSRGREIFLWQLPNQTWHCVMVFF